MTIGETFRNIAIETWFKLSDAKNAKMTFGEETITDINLLEIDKAHHPEIRIEKFNKPEEGKNGADWEFWLTGKSGKWLGLRIQAKVINLRNNNYDYLHYNDGEQTEKLIENSMKSSNKLIPLYCLYTMCDLSPYEEIFAYKNFVDKHEVYGCSFVDAFTVKNLGKKKHISHLIQDMIPWHCIFCPVFGETTDDLPERALYRINRKLQLLLQSDEVKIDEYVKKFTLSDTPPDYIINLSKFKYTSNGLEAPDNDLAGVVIIDEAKKIP